MSDITDTTKAEKQQALNGMKRSDKVDQPAPPTYRAATAGKDIPHADYIDEAESAHFTLADVLKGTAHSEMTVFEKKAALINAEIDQFGMGRYQWAVWFLTGFGYFLDLAWSQGVGLFASAMFQEFGVPQSEQGIIWSCANAGLAIGAIGAGIMADVIGRRWVFNGTCVITCVFGTLLAAPSYSYGGFCAIYLLASIGLGGNIPVDATICHEFLGQRQRSLVSLLSLWQPIGVVVASGIAYGTAAKPAWRCEPDLLGCRTQEYAALLLETPSAQCCTKGSNFGWRVNAGVLGAFTLVIFILRFFVFHLHESPKFLLSKGREQEAIDVLHKIAKFNKQPAPQLTVAHFAEIDAANNYVRPAPETGATTFKRVIRGIGHSVSHLKGLGKNRLQLTCFILLAFSYMGDYWSFNLAGAFLPLILLQYGIESTSNSVSDTYAQYIIIYAPGILGAVLALISVQLPLVGRKWSLVFSALMQGLSMALYTQVNSIPAYVGLNALEYIMQTYFNAVLYASAPELFDTAYRASASGALSCLGRLAGIVAPFAGQHYLATDSKGILWLGAGGIWVSALFMVFLPVEMRNRQMY